MFNDRESKKISIPKLQPEFVSATDDHNTIEPVTSVIQNVPTNFQHLKTFCSAVKRLNWIDRWMDEG